MLFIWRQHSRLGPMPMPMPIPCLLALAFLSLIVGPSYSYSLKGRIDDSQVSVGLSITRSNDRIRVINLKSTVATTVFQPSGSSRQQFFPASESQTH